MLFYDNGLVTAHGPPREEVLASFGYMDNTGVATVETAIVEMGNV